MFVGDALFDGELDGLAGVAQVVDLLLVTVEDPFQIVVVNVY